jgi:hypothetical protein
MKVMKSDERQLAWECFLDLSLALHVKGFRVVLNGALVFTGV